jgi:predicted DNA-binding transcriptional regulator AlpA
MTEERPAMAKLATDSTIILALPPRLLRKGEAAAYCGMSSAIFDRECTVNAIDFGGERLRRWDRRDLDKWIDQRKGGGMPRPAEGWLAEFGDDDDDGADQGN